MQNVNGGGRVFTIGRTGPDGRLAGKKRIVGGEITEAELLEVGTSQASIRALLGEGYLRDPQRPTASPELIGELDVKLDEVIAKLDAVGALVETLVARGGATAKKVTPAPRAKKVTPAPRAQTKSGGAGGGSS